MIREGFGMHRRRYKMRMGGGGNLFIVNNYSEKHVSLISKDSEAIVPLKYGMDKTTISPRFL